MTTERRPHIPVFLVPGIFFLLIVLFSSQNFLLNRQYALWQWVVWNATRWLPWLFWTPAIVHIGRRFPFRLNRRGRAFLIHMSACVILSVIVILMTYGMNRLSGLVLGFQAPLSFWIMAGELIHFSIVTYWLILAGGAFYDYYRKYLDRELAASRLEAKLANGRLLALRMKIQPHFLFNTLNAISALVRHDPGAAELMICRLSDLLRLTLDRSASQEILLQDEMEVVDLYLEIMKVRFGERLSTYKDISPEAMRAFVPNFILQPLIENSIRHGISARRAGGRLQIRARVADGRLHLQVEDDGPGFQDDPGVCIAKGMGLTNTVERLRGLYGADHRFLLAKSSSGGALVDIDIPYRQVHEAADPHREVVA